MNGFAASVTEARFRAPWVAAGAALGGCAAVAIIDPQRVPMSPPCPFRVATGWWCPFCGATRATASLASGDLSGAFRYNAMWMLAIPIVALVWGAWAFPDGAVARIVKRPKDWLSENKVGGFSTGFVLCAVVLVAFVFARNLAPGVESLRFPGA